MIQSILKLVRYKNLVFIIAIQWLMTACVIAPTLAMFHVPVHTTWWMQLLIIAATTLIAAGGYVVNDYFDLKIDRINRPDKVIVGNSIDKRTAMRLYQGTTVAGVIIGLAAAIVLRSWTIGMIFVIVPGMLWFYSASYKRQFLVGNIIVALSTALVPLLPFIVECGLLSDNYNFLIRETPILKTLYGWGCGFALFALLWTMIREIVKDLQDEYGDREMECRTVPIICGTIWTKIIVTALIFLADALLAYLITAKLAIPGDASTTFRYFLVGIVAPSICLLVILWSNSCSAYRNASALCKFIMVVGVLYAVVYHFLIAKAFGLPFLGIFHII
ncbi:MAG: geranylgeranylglycerol-phosphate geranylgeranyltransferase [Paludibacteraceae bacterium]